MRNIKLLLEYEGTNYRGWQIQADVPSIQGEIEKAITDITGEITSVMPSGRTDAGVHALGQVCNFRTKSKISVHSLSRAFNNYLPDDIVVKSAEEAGEGFNARRDAKSKTYLYQILNRETPAAIYRNFSWRFYYPLDIETMRKGGELLLGERDFSSFRAAGCQAEHAVRSIDRLTIDKNGEGLISIEVQGRSFLRHMVRIITGTLVDIGWGRTSLKEFEEIIAAKERSRAGKTAPGRGLFLKEVLY